MAQWFREAPWSVLMTHRSTGEVRHANDYGGCFVGYATRKSAEEVAAVQRSRLGDSYAVDVVHRYGGE